MQEVAVKLHEVLGEDLAKLHRGGGEFESEVLSKYPGLFSDVTELLGNDGNGWLHMLQQTLRGQAVRKATATEADSSVNVSYGIDESTSGLLSLIGLIHDLGEIIHGDVRDGDKTELYEIAVNQSGRDMSKAILKGLLSDELIDLAFDVELGRQTDAVDYDAVGIDKKQFDSIHDLWRTGIEYLEYFETGIVATKNISKVRNSDELTEFEKEELIAILEDYIAGTVSNNLPRLVKSALGDSLSSSTIAEFLLGKSSRTVDINNTVNHAVRTDGDRLSGSPTRLAANQWQHYKAANALIGFMLKSR